MTEPFKPVVTITTTHGNVPPGSVWPTEEWTETQPIKDAPGRPREEGAGMKNDDEWKCLCGVRGAGESAAYLHAITNGESEHRVSRADVVEATRNGERETWRHDGRHWVKVR